MTAALLILGSLCQVGQPLPAFELKYVRPAGGKYVLESAVTHKKVKDGYAYHSVTHRPREKMGLALFWNNQQQLQSAKLELEMATGKKTAAATFHGRTATVQRPGQPDVKIELAAPPVLATTAPDWSDILLVLRHYDVRKGGKQEFAGLWFHPEKAALSLTFTVEKLGQDEIAVGDKKFTLGRYRVHLRSGNYLVWADDDGQVYKLMPPGQPKAAVVLKGHEQAVLPLTGPANQ
jgi:hypothetical protein